MRCLGEVEGRQAAESLVAYLLTRGISTNIEVLPDHPDQWEIWVREEDRLQEANEVFREFTESPTDPKYSAALTEAAKILADREKQRQQVAKNMRKVQFRGGGAQGGPIPLTITLGVLCIVIGLLTNLGRPRPENELGTLIKSRLMFVDVGAYQESVERAQPDPTLSLRQGEIWRVITPIFLHDGPFHLGMNLFVLFSFGRYVERWLGTPRYALFVLFAAVLPNLLQGLMPEDLRGNPIFVGISGVTLSFFAYVWVRTSMDPTLGVRVPNIFAAFIVGYIVIGLSRVVPGWRIADLAHLGGFLVGVAAAFLPIARGR